MNPGRGVRLLVLSAFTLGVFAVYLASPVIQSSDSSLVIYESESLIHQRNFEVSEYGPVVHDWPCYRERGRAISRYPRGNSVVVLPFLALAEAGAGPLGVDLVKDLKKEKPRRLEKALASVIAALAALSLLLLAREVLSRVAPAVLLGVAFAFGTSLWSTASRGLWQHGPMVLVTAVGLLCLVRARRLDDWRWSIPAGLAWGAAFAIRPTIAAAIVLTALILAVVDRRAFAGFAVGAGVVIGVDVADNLSTYGTVIARHYVPGEGPVAKGLSTTLGEGLAGTMISPGRGLLVYSPFLALAGVGLWLRRRSLSALDLVAVGSILVLWFSAGNSRLWEGGASYGARILTETLPFWAYLMAPVFGLVVRPVRSWTPAIGAVAAALAITVSWSVFVHGRGALSWATQLWNSKPVVAYTGDRKRLWDWSDPAFLRTGHADFRDLYPKVPLPAVDPDQLCIYPR
jgi:dolichyl-phosphate-mannose-protein mannosyltransferase